MTDFITTNLRLELDATNQSLNRWTEKQVDMLKSTESNFFQNMEEFECTLAALKENESQLEDLRSKNDLLKEKQSEEISSYVDQIEKHKNVKLSLKSKINAIELEENNFMVKLHQVKEEHERARLNAERSLDDLTHGIKMYMHLGLEFQKAEKECMKFIFTNIDRLNPSNKYYFLMFVDGNDQYQLVETCPEIKKAISSKLLEALNTTNDIGKFVINMRKAFKNISEASNKSLII